MSDRMWTIVILLVAAVALVGWDVYVAAFNDERDDTISTVIQKAALRHPLLPFAFGVLMGHFFWPL